MTPRSPATFFQSPRLLEERKPFYNALYSQPARASAFSGLGKPTLGQRIARPPPSGGSGGPSLQQQAAALFPGNYAAQMAWIAAQGSVNGLAGLGDWFTDGLKTLHTNAMDALDTVTGRKAAVEQQKAAEALAMQQQTSILEQAKLRAMGWAKTAPWLTIGGTVLGLGVLYVALKKKGG